MKKTGISPVNIYNYIYNNIYYEKNHLKILSYLIVDVLAENFQVKFINCYLREIVSFTKN